MSHETMSHEGSAEEFTASASEKPAASLESTNWRLRRSIEMLLKLAVSPPEVSGQENIDKIGPSDKVVVVVSHVSGGPDLDMPVAVGALAPHLDLVVSNQSTHHSFREEPGMWPSIQLAGGEKNFKPIGYHRDPTTGLKTPDMFDPAEADEMEGALNDGRRVVVAASSPYPVEKADEQTKVEAAKPGYMAAYLAGKTGATILPVGVWVGEAAPGERRRPAKVAIGGPFKLDASAEEIGEMGDIMTRRTNGQPQEGDGRQLAELAGKLREQSQLVFDTVMQLRPHGDAPPAVYGPEQQADLVQQAREAVDDAAFHHDDIISR
jgi:hypothetical protein